MGYILVAQESDRWRAHVNWVMNLWFHKLQEILH
jgi:hypothetical protein